MPSKTYHIITIGCQMNEADSERVASRLEQSGYKKTHDKYGADLVVINTCGVRQSAENRIYGLIPGIKKESASRRRNVKIILTGCLAERKDVKRRLKDYVDVWLPINGIKNYELGIKNEMPRSDVWHSDDNYLNIKPKYESNFSALVPIGNGCDNFCSYCVVPYARGKEVYRQADDILAEVKELVKNGCKEVILIAQNVNSYKCQILNPKSQTNSKSKILNSENKVIDFANLLKMVNLVQGDFWVRFFTSHPKDMSDKLIKTMAECRKVCRQVHLPAQAGDNHILKKMNRKYTVEHYKGLIKKIRQAMPDASITTDLIVGFPGETKRQFNNSVKLFKQVKFDMAYLAQYSPRPGTEAAKLRDNISKSEKQRREEELNEVLKKTALKHNKKYVGKTVKVLVDGKNKSGQWLGRTGTGKAVSISGRAVNLIGKIVKVKIISVRDFGMTGKIIN